MRVPDEVAELPRFETQSDQWATWGYAFDGASVLTWYVDRKEQDEGVTSEITAAAFFESDAEAAAKAWLRALLAKASR